MGSVSEQSAWALVTGASSGIGFELCKLLAADGYSLVMTARNSDRLTEAAQAVAMKFEIDTMVITADLADPESPGEIMNRLRDRAISPSILINNAGFDVYGRFEDTNIRHELEMIQVNIAALTMLTKLLLPEMARLGHGRIMNLGSIGSFVPSPLNAVYCATKAYVLSFSEALAEELSDTGVTVTAFCPGATKTQFHKRAGMEQVSLLRSGWADAAKVAQTGYRAMQSGQRVCVSGGTNRLMTFLTRFMPRRVVTSLAGQALKEHK